MYMRIVIEKQFVPVPTSILDGDFRILRCRLTSVDWDCDPVDWPLGLFFFQFTDPEP